MKIIVALNGEISIETNGSDPKAIAALIRELHKPAKKTKTAPAPAEPVDTGLAVDPAVSPQQMQTWQWLVNNDAPTGRSAQDLADALGLENGTAGLRLSRLVQNGLAHKVSRGLYRAGDVQ